MPFCVARLLADGTLDTATFNAGARSGQRGPCASALHRGDAATADDVLPGGKIALAGHLSLRSGTRTGIISRPTQQRRRVSTRCVRHWRQGMLPDQSNQRDLRSTLVQPGMAKMDRVGPLFSRGAEAFCLSPF